MLLRMAQRLITVNPNRPGALQFVAINALGSTLAQNGCRVDTRGATRLALDGAASDTQVIPMRNYLGVYVITSVACPLQTVSRYLQQ